jgi:uncharacterized membrane protein YidH (DUF202 family)
MTLSLLTVKALNWFEDERTMDALCLYAVLGSLLVSVVALMIGIVCTVLEILRTEDSDKVVIDV